jgi:hypothetical protein
MTGSKHWTEKELTLLIRKYETTPIEEMMKLLPGRSKNAESRIQDGNKLH